MKNRGSRKNMRFYISDVQKYINMASTLINCTKFQMLIRSYLFLRNRLSVYKLKDDSRMAKIIKVPQLVIHFNITKNVSSIFCFTLHLVTKTFQAILELIDYILRCTL